MYFLKALWPRQHCFSKSLKIPYKSKLFENSLGNAEVKEGKKEDRRESERERKKKSIYKYIYICISPR